MGKEKSGERLWVGNGAFRRRSTSTSNLFNSRFQSHFEDHITKKNWDSIYEHRIKYHRIGIYAVSAS